MSHYKSPCPLPTAHERELLVILIEECGEVLQRATKALRFGLGEYQPGQPLNNAQRLGLEIGDVSQMVDQLMAVGAVSPVWIAKGSVAKKKQLAKFMQTEAPSDVVPVMNFDRRVACEGSIDQLKKLNDSGGAPVVFDPETGVPFTDMPEFCPLYKCVTTSKRANYEGGKYNCIGDETRRLVKDDNGFWTCPTCHYSW